MTKEPNWTQPAENIEKEAPIFDTTIMSAALKKLDQNSNGRLDGSELLAEMTRAADAPADPATAAIKNGYRAALGTLCTQDKAALDTLLTSVQQGTNQLLYPNDDPKGLTSDIGKALAILPESTYGMVGSMLFGGLQSVQQTFPKGVEIPTAEQVCNSSLPLAVKPLTEHAR